MKKILLTCTLVSSLQALPTESFFDLVTSIKKELFKISAEELSKMLHVASEVPLITADQLQQQLETDSSLLVVNVLTAYYHNDCHIKGSINAPLPELVDHAHAWDRSQKIVVYCALDECDAGEKGCMLLSCMGFTDVCDYRGGIKEWFQLGYPTEGPALSEYLHIKGLTEDEYKLYPDSLVCSRQTRWSSRYQN